MSSHNQIEETRREINRLYALEDNWNSYGGFAPNPIAIEAANRIAIALQDQGRPKVGATPDGEVVLSWPGAIDVTIGQESC